MRIQFLDVLGLVAQLCAHRGLHLRHLTHQRLAHIFRYGHEGLLSVVWLAPHLRLLRPRCPLLFLPWPPLTLGVEVNEPCIARHALRPAIKLAGPRDRTSEVRAGWA